MNNKIKQLNNGDFEVLPEFETCVICGVQTNEPKDKHIDFRYNYVEGVGQLCSKCSEKYE
jgi:recombinational DNA repair protein (RecF pathway)